MEVVCPVLPSQHRLPLQEATGNVQSHASNNSNNTLAYCSPVTASHSSPASTSSLPSSALPLVSCTQVSSVAASSIPSAPILPTQSLDISQHNNVYTYHSQHTQPTFYPEALIKQLPSQQYTQHSAHKYQQQQQQQQLLSRRHSIHHGSLALGGGFPGGSVISSSNGLGPAIPNANANVNPIYLSPQFQAYRKKQTEKDDKTEQIWPDVLEDAFLDALLLIPQMGRKKYAMRGQLHGRNMLISEYLWVAYCLSLPAGVKPDSKMARGRKQVSSHIQVLKNFFIHHRCYHFFFPSKEKKEDTRKDLLEKESFKDNRVLRALFDGRLPEERPNYEYFGQLLASDGLVAIRPSLCWILVSSAAVRYESDGPHRGEATKPDGLPLDGRVYPHLHLNNKREEWPERGKIIRGTLLQEYTRALSQKEASSVRDISQDWKDRFPGQMCEALDQVVREDLRDILHFHVTLDVQEPDRFPEGSELNSLVEVTIEQAYLQNHRWKSVTRLARPSELVPGRPDDEETGSSANQVPVSVITRDIGNQYMHRPGCHGVGNGGHCDCFQSARMRRQQLAVPFPAPEWATMLSMLTAYRRHPLEEDGGEAAGVYASRASSKKSSGKRSSYGSTATSASTSTRRRESDRFTEVGDDVGDDSFTSASSADSTGSNGTPTQMDLVRNIAMLQELWSCDPSSPSSTPSEDGSSAPTWVRRAVILWTFETVYSVNERKMEVVKMPAGTGWRFLTTIDPASEYHQRQALVMPGSKGMDGHREQQQHHQQHQQHQNHQNHQNHQHHQHHQQVPSPPHSSTPQPYPMSYQTRRDSDMSPHPGYHQHLTAAMSEHLSSSWDPNGNAGDYRQLSPPESYQVPGPLGLLDTTYGAGLATPPPTASLPSPYATTIDNQHQHQQHQHQHQQHQHQHQQHQQHQHQQHQHQQRQHQAAVHAYNQHQQSFPGQLGFLSAPSPADTESSRSQAAAAGGHTQPVIDPFLAAAAAAVDSGSSGNGGSSLPDWDTHDVAQAFGGWPVTTGGSTAGGAGPVTARGPSSWQQQQHQQQQHQQQNRGLKRGRSDSLDDTSGYPVASMPKLSHNGFSSWR
ncbi:transcription factor [Grosmannia clavigera kw1407]|uniref:Transcription factor n=1 Tax=Grosmannia clavigera (strain kw1407 / UAMH 11150) TaxID=655863 RepID=F0XAI1_GROCL|nr:transcription factor [Grosmannia clavigera kw1407]EFX06178.1 transcription factor [Grosmannia clavigera kw1407]